MRGAREDEDFGAGGGTPYGLCFAPPRAASARCSARRGAASSARFGTGTGAQRALGATWLYPRRRAVGGGCTRSASSSGIERCTLGRPRLGSRRALPANDEAGSIALAACVLAGRTRGVLASRAARRRPRPRPRPRAPPGASLRATCKTARPPPRGPVAAKAAGAPSAVRGAPLQRVWWA